MPVQAQHAPSMPGSTTTGCARHLSAPPTLRSPDSIRKVMLLDNIINHDEQSDAAANQARHEAASALLGLGARQSSNPKTLPDVPSGGIAAPTPAVGHHSKALPTSPDMPMLPPASMHAFTRDGSSSSYAPSAVVAQTQGSATSTEDGDDIDMDMGNNGTAASGNPNDREFVCWATRTPCMLGQYTLNCSRKMVSDYFGRNKTKTFQVEESRWIRWCRKHYQRRSYRDTWGHHKGSIVLKQLEAINEQEAGLRYRFGLKATEETRLNDYNSKLIKEQRHFDLTADEAVVMDKENLKVAPLAVLHELKQFAGSHARLEDNTLSGADCTRLVELAIQMVREKRCLSLPLFEMVPQFKAKATATPKGKKSGAVAKKTAPKSKGASKGESAAGTKRKSEEDDDGSSPKKQKT